MNRIIKIGMDVHTTNYTLCAMEPMLGGDDRVIANLPVAPDYKEILRFIKNLKKKLGPQDDYSVECGYEAGCLGYSLYNQLTGAGVKCVILAPSTMLTQQGVRVKTDRRDAELIAKCMAYGGYHSVYIPTAKDDSVKEYIRMRDDHKEALKKIKLQIHGFCTRHGFIYEGCYWTERHLSWLKHLEVSGLYRETLDEYLVSYAEQNAKINRFDERITDLASDDDYREKVSQLGCLLGIKVHTALSLIVETGDFSRFSKGNKYAAFLGLVPGEKSSAESIRRTGITKAGNTHLRRLLVECSRGICRGRVGQKSKDLIARQKGNRPEVIAYADRANTRIRSKYYRMIRHSKKTNVAVAAVARELACFIWGIMTDNIAPVNRGVKMA